MSDDIENELDVVEDQTDVAVEDDGEATEALVDELASFQAADI